jgi:hypothetical protein
VEQLAVRPLLSVTVRTTVLVPILLQLKIVVLKLIDAIPAAAVLPLFTSAEVIVATPFTSVTVTGLQLATGGCDITLTVTVCVAVEVLPAASVAIHVIVVEPTGYCVRALFEMITPGTLSVAVALPKLTLVAKD